MQGDLNVDLLMLPVLYAIERHVKGRDAITDIYNRAYEAVMTSMDVKPATNLCPNCRRPMTLVCRECEEWE